MSVSDASGATHQKLEEGRPPADTCNFNLGVHNDETRVVERQRSVWQISNEYLFQVKISIQPRWRCSKIDQLWLVSGSREEARQPLGCHAQGHVIDQRMKIKSFRHHQLFIDQRLT